MMRFHGDYRMLVAGALVGSNGTLAIVNPANEGVIGEAPDCSREQLDEAVAQARAAFPGWRDTPHEARRALLHAAADRLATHAEPLARLLTSEQGKPLEQARRELRGAGLWLRSMADMEIPVTRNENNTERWSETHHVPIGVVGAISPWNFPVLLSVWKIAPALAAGNCVILKPSPFTPLTMLKVGELLADLFPPGVLTIISGGDALGPWLTAHPGIDKISFTGSTATGRRVMESAATNLKRLTLELGGNDAAIVLPDVNIAEIAPKLFWAAFRNSGQFCIAAKRLYIHEAIYEALAVALVDYARSVRIGDGADEATQLGPIQNRLQYDRLTALINECRAEGMRFLLGGTVEQTRPGYFVPVTILDNPPETARVVAEEPFGPILPLLRFTDVADVIARANASPYGLAASVWSEDTDAALSIARRLEAGTVWINEAQHLMPFQSFAGHKQSGFGVENGLAGLMEYTLPQTITIKRAAA